MQKIRKKGKNPRLLDTFLLVEKLFKRLKKNSRSDDFWKKAVRSRQSWPEPGRAARAMPPPTGAAAGAATSLPALGPPAQPVHHGRDIPCDQRSGAGVSCPQKSPGLAGLPGEEISNLSANQTAESEQRGEKKETTGKRNLS